MDTNRTVLTSLPTPHRNQFDKIETHTPMRFKIVSRKLKDPNKHTDSDLSKSLYSESPMAQNSKFHGRSVDKESDQRSKFHRLGESSLVF